VTDTVAVINAYLSGDSSSINVSVADVNRDGVIDITDAVAIINLTFGSKRGSKNGSKLATLVEVMCYAQDDSFFASPWYRPARSALLPALKAHLPRLQSRLGAKASKNFLFNTIL